MLPASESGFFKSRSGGDSPGNRRKHAEEGKEDGEEPQLKKRGQKAREEAIVPEVPRRVARLCGADPEDADAGGRRTRGKTG